MTEHTASHFLAHPDKGEVSTLLHRPKNAHWLYIFGHGAGVNMHHISMETFSLALAEVGIATFRYHFPYMERGRGGMDSMAVRLATVRGAVDAAAKAAPDLLLLAGGKSMGGRMTSEAQSISRLPNVRGLVFLGFPLHPAGKPSTDRGAHLRQIDIPMLFLQGTRDKLADLSLLQPICEEIGADIHIVESADHGFKVLKRSGKTFEGVNMELANAVAAWVGKFKGRSDIN